MESVRKANIFGKLVLLRGDLDVPIKNGKVFDDSRLRAMLPTLNYLSENHAKVILIGHLGRPKGQIVENLTLKPVAEKLRNIGGFIDFSFIDNCLGESVSSAVSNLREGSILMLENLRFYPQEEDNDLDFAKDLSNLAEIYVNDCFPTSHRKDASLSRISKFIPSYAGLDLEREVSSLDEYSKKIAHPYTIILGGAKKDKLAYLLDFQKKADYVLLGSLLSSMLTDSDKASLNTEVIFGEGGEDLSDHSIDMFVDVLSRSKTVVWAGPLGKYESGYTKGTEAIARAILESKALSIVGGGDTIAVLAKLGLSDSIGYLSEAGGALLHFMSGKKLPGLEALGFYG